MAKSDQFPQMNEGEKELRNEFPRLEPRLYDQALKLTNYDFARAEDLVQNTFERALKYIHNYQPGSHLGAWLGRVLQNLYFSELRSEKREMTRIVSEAEGDFEYHPDVDALSPEEATYASQRSKMVEELPENLLKIVSMLSAGSSFEDIAKEMGISKQEAAKLGHEALRIVSEREGEKYEHERPIITPNETIFDYLTQKQIQDLLSRLSLEQRKVFTARVLEGKKYDNVAAELQIPVGTVKSIIFRVTERIIKLAGIQLKEKLSAFEQCQDAARREPKRFLRASLRLEPHKQRIVATLVQNPNSTFAELAGALGTSKATLAAYVHDLVRDIVSTS